MTRLPLPLLCILLSFALLTGCHSPVKSTAKAAGRVTVAGAKASAKATVEGAKITAGAALDVAQSVVGRDDEPEPEEKSRRDK